MALNKNALIRYKTLDKCFQNIYRKWSLDDLINACSEALYEYEGRKINLSKRTVQMDIQMMRSDKLGYNAPIVVYDKKYYKYEIFDFSISNIPLTENDMNILSETVEMLKQFKNISLFSELGGVIQKLEDKIYTQKDNVKPIVFIEKNENLKGLEFLDLIYQSIIKKICLEVIYKPFKAILASRIIIHPYILKEYNNRWFLVGKSEKNNSIITLALDRIIDLEYNLEINYINDNFDGEKYYENTIGVTVLKNSKIREIILKINQTNAPYVLTKPFHNSQKVITTFKDGSILIAISVQINYELDKLILGFGDSIEVIKPKSYREKIKHQLSNAFNLYK